MPVNVRNKSAVCSLRSMQRSLAIKESFSRSKQFGVDPDLKCNSRCLPEHEFNEKKRFLSVLIKASNNVMGPLLREYDYLKPASIVIENSGIVIEARATHTSTLKEMENDGMQPGYIWREDTVGTTAGSLALSTNLPFVASGDDFYCHQFRRWTCVSAPVKNKRGDALCIIDLSFLNPLAHRSAGDIKKILESVARSALNIQNQLLHFENSVQIPVLLPFFNSIIQNHPEPIVGVTKEGETVFVSAKASKILHSSSGNGCLERDFSFMSDIRHNISKKIPVKNNEEILGYIVVLDNKEQTNQIQMKATEKQNILFENIVGKNQDFLEAINLARQVSSTDLPVLILGETGTGKELLAHAIHNRSAREGGPFIAVNCAGIPRSLLESELFGYTEGAFTGAKRFGNPGKFELASGGTLFLDEVGELSLDAQAALLRVVENNRVFRIGATKSTPIDTRIIAATNRNLADECRNGRFRSDLFYRLHVVPINLPCLRERKDDIPALIGFLLIQIGFELNRPNIKIESSALAFLQQYDWPGNIRELKNVLQYATMMVQGDKINLEHLPRYLLVGNAGFCSITINDSYAGEPDVLRKVIQECEGNIAKAARYLGFSRNTIYKKIKEYRISLDEIRGNMDRSF